MPAILKRSCIFCDQPSKLTKEHLWSKWTRKLVAHDSFKHEYVDQVFNLGGVERTVKTIGGDARNRGLKAVCRRCNNTWMSSIEESTKSALRPLILGNKTVLDRNNQMAVAIWIAMKTMVAEYFDPGKVAITLGERQFLHGYRQIPKSNWRIWIGNYDRSKWAGQWVHSALGIAPSKRAPDRDPNIPNTQTTTFVVGKLYAHIFSSEMISLVNGVSLGPKLIEKMAQIWPIQEDVILWPTNAMDDVDADVSAMAIFDRLKDALLS